MNIADNIIKNLIKEIDDGRNYQKKSGQSVCE